MSMTGVVSYTTSIPVEDVDDLEKCETQGSDSVASSSDDTSSITEDGIDDDGNDGVKDSIDNSIEDNNVEVILTEKKSRGLFKKGCTGISACIIMDACNKSKLNASDVEDYTLVKEDVVAVTSTGMSECVETFVLPINNSGMDDSLYPFDERSTLYACGEEDAVDKKWDTLLAEEASGFFDAESFVFFDAEEHDNGLISKNFVDKVDQNSLSPLPAADPPCSALDGVDPPGLMIVNDFQCPIDPPAISPNSSTSSPNKATTEIAEVEESSVWENIIFDGEQTTPVSGTMSPDKVIVAPVSPDSHTVTEVTKNIKFFESLSTSTEQMTSVHASPEKPTSVKEEDAENLDSEHLSTDPEENFVSATSSEKPSGTEGGKTLDGENSATDTEEDLLCVHSPEKPSGIEKGEKTSVTSNLSVDNESMVRSPEAKDKVAQREEESSPSLINNISMEDKMGEKSACEDQISEAGTPPTGQTGHDNAEVLTESPASQNPSLIAKGSTKVSFDLAHQKQTLDLGTKLLDKNSTPSKWKEITSMQSPTGVGEWEDVFDAQLLEEMEQESDDEDTKSTIKVRSQSASKKKRSIASHTTPQTIREGKAFNCVTATPVISPNGVVYQQLVKGALYTPKVGTDVEINFDTPAVSTVGIYDLNNSMFSDTPLGCTPLNTFTENNEWSKQKQQVDVSFDDFPWEDYFQLGSIGSAQKKHATPSQNGRTQHGCRLIGSLDRAFEENSRRPLKILSYEQIWNQLNSGSKSLVALLDLATGNLFRSWEKRANKFRSLDVLDLAVDFDPIKVLQAINQSLANQGEGGGNDQAPKTHHEKKGIPQQKIVQDKRRMMDALDLSVDHCGIFCHERVQEQHAGSKKENELKTRTSLKAISLQQGTMAILNPTLNSSAILDALDLSVNNMQKFNAQNVLEQAVGSWFCY